MNRSHSKRTHPAKKSIPKEEVKELWEGYPSPTQRKQMKHDHTRRSRRFLKQSQRWEYEEDLH